MTSYDQDIAAWATEQAALLRAGRFDALDIEHLADEIEDVGKSEQRELANRLTVLIAHLLNGATSREGAAAVGGALSPRSAKTWPTPSSKPPASSTSSTMPNGGTWYGRRRQRWPKRKPDWKISPKPARGASTR